MSTTKHTSFIPISPELLPLQKLNEVVTVPAILKGLAPQCITALITITLTYKKKTGCFGTTGRMMEPDHGAGSGY